MFQLAWILFFLSSFLPPSIDVIHQQHMQREYEGPMYSKCLFHLSFLSSLTVGMVTDACIHFVGQLYSETCAVKFQ